MADMLITEKMDPVGPTMLEEAGHRVVQADRDMDIIRRELPQTDVIVVRIVDLTPELLSQAKQLKLISKHGVGVDNIDMEWCKANHVAVTITPGANSQAVAEHALAMMMTLAKHMIPVSNDYRDKGFSAKNSPPSMEMWGKTLGIIGCGRIGSLLAKMTAFGFGMKVLAYDPYLTAAPEGVELTADRDRVFQEADFLSLHPVLNDETRSCVGERELSLMKPTAYLINCGRGPLVDEPALIRALEAGAIAGAGLDVTAKEPCEPDSPLFQMRNVILTPHFAATTLEAAAACSRIAAENVLDILAGKRPAGQLV